MFIRPDLKTFLNDIKLIRSFFLAGDPRNSKTSTHRVRIIWSIVWIRWQFKVLKSHSKASRTCISVFVMTITEADYKLLPCSFVQFQFLQQRTSGWLGSSFLYKHWLHNSWMLNDFIKSLAHCSRCLLLSPSCRKSCSFITSRILHIFPQLKPCHQF